MSGNNQVSSGTGSQHGRSVSAGSTPSAVPNTPNNRPYINNRAPNTHPQRRRGFRGNRPQIPTFQANPPHNLGPVYNSPRANSQANQGYNPGFLYHPAYPTPQANDLNHAASPFNSAHINPIAIQACRAGLHYNPTVASTAQHWYFCIQITIPSASIMNVRHEMTARQRATARLQHLDNSKRSINEQRGFVRATIERMGTRLDALEAINSDPAEPNTKLSEFYAAQAALEKADEDMNELARAWDEIELEYDEIMAGIAFGEHGI